MMELQHQRLMVLAGQLQLESLIRALLQIVGGDKLIIPFC